MNTRDMMIYVERIVRPVRATEGRKMLMRRELLAHLTAAFEEECRDGRTESEAWENATKRLGNPAELTRSLQASVPFVQRLFLGHIPMPRVMRYWETSTGHRLGMTRMSLGEQALITLGAMVLAYGTAILLALSAQRAFHDALMRALGENEVRFKIGMALGAICLLVFQGAAFNILGAAVRNRSVVKGSLVLMGSILAWQVATISIAASQRLAPVQLLCGVVASVLLSGALIGLGRLTARLGRKYQEWLGLEIPE